MVNIIQEVECVDEIRKKSLPEVNLLGLFVQCFCQQGLDDLETQTECWLEGR